MRIIMVVILLCIWSIPSFAADARERRFISKGMTEAEVLMKIGKPDSDSMISGGGARGVQKVWSYFPASEDSQTLTTITIRNGTVLSVERTLSRLNADASKRRFISRGMSEGEVLLEIGKPDNESMVSGEGARGVQKIWSYFPTSGDSQTLTTITIRNGTVLSVERTISR